MKGFGIYYEVSIEDENGYIMYSHIKCSIDPYTKKDWYDVKAPVMFTNRNIGKTLVTRTQGKSIVVYL